MSMDFSVPEKRKIDALPRFFLDPQENAFRSANEGRAVFDDVEMVEIIIPGDKNAIACERVKDHHRQRWPAVYDAFKKGLEPPEIGTPLEQWPPCSPATVQNLKSLNIRTVEALAGVQDGLLQNLGIGARSLRDRAQAWLNNVEKQKPLDELVARAVAAEEKSASMQSTLDAMKAQIEKLTAAKNV